MIRSERKLFLCLTGLWDFSANILDSVEERGYNGKNRNVSVFEIVQHNFLNMRWCIRVECTDI